MPKNPKDFFRYYDAGCAFSDGQPLRPVFQISQEIMNHESRKRARSTDQEVHFTRIVSSLLANVHSACQVHGDLYTAVSMRNQAPLPKRYLPGWFGQTSFKIAIRALHELGYIEFLKGNLDREKNGGRWTRVRATDKLIQFLNGHFNQDADTTKYTVPEPIVMHQEVKTKGKKKKKKKQITIEYEDTDETIRMRANCENINRFLAEQNISISLPQKTTVELAGVKKYGKNPLLVDQSRNQIHRVFNLSSLNYGGRFYGGWWQIIGKKFRPFITINGASTFELDYSGLIVSMLYDMEGVEMPRGDAYALDGYDEKFRDKIKLAIIILINAEKGIDWRQFKRPKGKSIADFQHDLRNKYAPIEKYFGSGIGRELQRKDSDIAEHVLLSLMDQNIVTLPIHDSFIVRQKHCKATEQAMVEAYEHVMGNKPSVDLKWRWALPVLAAYEEADKSKFATIDISKIISSDTESD